MIIAPSGLIANMESDTRNPTGSLYISWRNILVSGEWFQLDSSLLDSGAMLTKSLFLNGQTVTEFISDIDSRAYDDESENIISMEGYSESVGDNGQYTMSDFDCELNNTDNRYLPRKNKNILSNPGFEESKSDWNDILGSGASIVVDEIYPHGQYKCLYYTNPSHNECGSLSSPVSMYDGSQVDIPESWVLSGYATGSGVLTMFVGAYDSKCIGNDKNLSSGLKAYSRYSSTLVSGSWSRPSVALTVPSGSIYLRAFVSIASGVWSRVDDCQLEKALVATPIDESFIGDFILPKRLIKASVGFGGSNIPKFAGLTDRIVPSTKGDTVSIHAYDVAERLKGVQVLDTYYENKRTDEIISELASLANIDASTMSLEAGSLTIEFAYFPEGSVWYYMTQVAEAEGGRIFFDEDGTLRFWSRTHYKASDSPVYTFDFDRDILNIDYEISNANVKNRIKVTAKPKILLTNQRIFSDDTGQSMTNGENKEFFCQFAFRNETSLPCLNVQVPTVGVEILANTAQDGSGTNVSANISISSYYIFRESMRINLQSSYAGTCYITKLVIYGDPIATKSNIEIIENDIDSQSLYDVQELPIENDLITSDAYATTLAQQRLAEMKDPRSFVNIDVVGVPYLQVGDKVRTQLNFGGDYDDFYIVKNRWTFSDDFIQTLNLEKKVIA